MQSVSKKFSRQRKKPHNACLYNYTASSVSICGFFFFVLGKTEVGQVTFFTCSVEGSCVFFAFVRHSSNIFAEKVLLIVFSLFWVFVSILQALKTEFLRGRKNAWYLSIQTMSTQQFWFLSSELKG